MSPLLHEPAEAAVLALEAACGGQLSYCAVDLGSGQVVARRADALVKTASIIKLAVLVHVALLVETGAARWSERLPLGDFAKAPGMGVLRALAAGLELTLHDLCWLMTAISDNTATNMLIARCGVAAINARSRSLGLTQTTLFRQMFEPDTPESAVYGPAATTARETAALLSMIARRQIGAAETAETLLAMLGAQQDLVGVPRGLPPGWRYAGKTGSDSDLRNDAAIVTAPDGRQLALALFCQELPERGGGVDHPGLLALRDLTRLLLNVA